MYPTAAGNYYNPGKMCTGLVDRNKQRAVLEDRQDLWPLLKGWSLFRSKLKCISKYYFLGFTLAICSDLGKVEITTHPGTWCKGIGKAVLSS